MHRIEKAFSKYEVEQMQETDLRRLKRTDLLELLLEQSKEVERLTAELDTARQALQDRTIRMEQAGSIAEAALQLNGIFDTAQAAAQQYLDNIQMLNDRQTATCLEREAASRAQAEQLLAETKEKCAAMEADTRQQCETKLQETERQVEEKWQSISERLEAFYQAHEGLRELVEFSGSLAGKDVNPQ